MSYKIRVPKLGAIGGRESDHVVSLMPYDKNIYCEDNRKPCGVLSPHGPQKIQAENSGSPKDYILVSIDL